MKIDGYRREAGQYGVMLEEEMSHIDDGLEYDLIKAERALDGIKDCCSREAYQFYKTIWADHSDLI